MPREAAGGCRKQPQASWWEASPAREAWASANVSSPWPPAKPDRNYTQHVPAIARTMSVWRYSAISARDGSRSATANSMRHRPQRSRHTRQPDPASLKRHRAVLPGSNSLSQINLRILEGLPNGADTATRRRQVCFFKRCRAWGTDGSNPVCSTGESGTNRRRRVHDPLLKFWMRRRSGRGAAGGADPGGPVGGAQDRGAGDTTVQPKAIAHPTDARLCHRPRRNGGIVREGFGSTAGVVGRSGPSSGNAVCARLVTLGATSRLLTNSLSACQASKAAWTARGAGRAHSRNEHAGGTKSENAAEGVP
jgi:hypothetical protein